MFVMQVQPNIPSGIAESTIIDVVDQDPVGRLIMVENLDANNTFQYKWQYSYDKVIWNDIGVYAVLAPKHAVPFLIQRSEPYLRLRGSGLLSVGIAFLRFKSFAGNLPLVTL